MKNRYFYLFCGLVAAIGVPACAQVINPIPARVFGQYDQPKTVLDLVTPPSTALNLLEGREFYSPLAVAVDATSSPAIIYVVDAGNNRVLGWKDYSTYTNGATADIVLGQRDLYSNLSYTGTALASFGSGLYSPSAVVVDKHGNVFVMDSGNNRVLRYPTPAAPRDDNGPILADLIIGQANLTSSLANRGVTEITESSIQTTSTATGGVQLAGLAFDADGNLWLADAGNHRLLRYAKGDVSGTSNTSSDGATIRANYVLGQSDLNTNSANPGRVTPIDDRINKLKLRFPNAIAFDASGNLFCIDDLGRVVVFQPPFEQVGKSASRILGLYSAVQGQAAPPVINNFNFATYASGGTFIGGPRGLFTVGDYLFVADTGNNRVVRFDPVKNWAEEGSGAFSPPMSDPYTLFGQDDYNRGEPNGVTGWEPSARYLDGPIGGAFLNGEVYLVDSRNHRVLVLPYNTDWNFLSPATRVLGQVDFPFRTPNLIQGREFGIGTLQVSSTLSLNLGIGMAMDTTTPGAQHLYIADTANHRVLGFADAKRARTGDQADLVIGQVGLFRSIPNSPDGNPQKPTRTGLVLPSAVAVDAEGNLWVADTGNGRVLRYANPFKHPEGPFEADIVIGQPDFNTRTDGVPTADRLFRPAGLALTFDGHLVVSDIAHNRVLLFRQPFSNGEAAGVILGQPDAETGTTGSSESQLNLPMGVAVDTDDRLYVADTLNGRLSVFDRINTQITGANAALVLSVAGGQPFGVTVSPRTGQIFVPELKTSRVLRYPRFDQLITSGNYAADSNFLLQTYGPRSVLLDPVDNLFIADSANRITMHYPQLSVVNGMNGFPKVAPAMIALLRAPGVTFTSVGGSASGPELPKQLGDVEVFVNGVPAPLTQVDADNVRLIVPKSSPTTGQADFLVRRISDGQILAYSRVSMTSVSPAVIFQGANPGTTGQALATNQDGGSNSATSGAAVGQEITVLLTGYGPFDGLPDDGLAPGSAVPVPETPRAFIRVGTGVTECPVVSSTLDPDRPGVWRVKVKVPQVSTNGSYGFLVLYKSVASDTMTNPALSVRPTIQVNR